MKSLLITYRYLSDHDDPLFNEFTYGDSKAGARRLKKDLGEGDYIFFHTSIGGKKYITAYYVVDRVLDTVEAIKNRNIVAKYRNPHILECQDGERREDDDVVVFGDPITSMDLKRTPILFDRSLAGQLSLNIGFPKGETDSQAIGFATRPPRKLTDKDVDILLDAAEEAKKKVFEKLLSTNEIVEFREKDIENIIENNPQLLGESLKLVKRQMVTPVGRIDLLFKDEEGNEIVVELKLDKIGKEAINQVRKYMNERKKETDKKKVTGAIVCQGVMPSFWEEFEKLKDIEIFCYGWQPKICRWKDTEPLM